MKVTRHGEPIMHPLPFPTRGNQAGSSQIREMSRDLRLWRADHFNEVADADFLLGHEMDQPQPCGISERAEELVQRNWPVLLCHKRIIHIRLDRCMAPRI